MENMMPPDPFSGELEDFLPMARNARKMYEAAVVAGFTEAQAMEWMIRLTAAMVTAQQSLSLPRSSGFIYSWNWTFMPMPHSGAFFMPANVMEACGTF